MIEIRKEIASNANARAIPSVPPEAEL